MGMTLIEVLQQTIDIIDAVESKYKQEYITHEKLLNLQFYINDIIEDLKLIKEFEEKE